MDKKFLRILLFFVWVLLCTTHAFFLHSLMQLNWEVVVFDSLIYNILYVIFAGGIWFSLRFEKNKNSVMQNTLVLYLPMIAIVTSLWIIIGYFFTNLIIDNAEYIEFNSVSLMYRVVLGVFMFSMVIIFYYLIKYYRDIQERNLKNINLEKELQRSKFDFLQVQIQPHFLFNALNSISSLTYEDAEKTRKMIVKLSEFLRYTTKYSDKGLVKLSDELSHIDKYLDIEILRFGSRLSLKKNIEEQAYSKLLPTLILQPLMENAIKHGVYKSINSVTIELSAKVVQGKLQIVIANNKDESKDAIGTKTGLKNLSKRLRIIYGESAIVNINNTVNRFSISLLIPQKVI